jgi:glutaredoxin/glutathione-dependent peroxiredoxin
MIAIGERVPNTTFQIMTDAGPANVTAQDIFGGKSVMLFGVPGAFTPSCHYIHMPGVLGEVETLREAGVDIVACTAVNDAFVLDVWAEAIGAKGKILFLGDGNADFVSAAGLELDATHLGLGLRSRRYAMWARDGYVEALNVEADPSIAEVSSAYAMLKTLNIWMEVR